jgi:hypothetical protein
MTGYEAKLSPDQELKLQAQMIGGPGQMMDRMMEDFKSSGAKKLEHVKGRGFDEYKSFWMMQKTGMIDSKNTFEDYLSGNIKDAEGGEVYIQREDKIAMETVLSRRINREIGETWKDAVKPMREVGLAPLAKLSDERQMFAEGSLKFIMDLQRGPGGVQLDAGENVHLHKQLQENGATRQGMDNLLRAIRDNPGKPELWVDAYNKAIDSVKGGKDSPAGRALTSIYEKARDDRFFRNRIVEKYGMGRGSHGFATMLGRIGVAENLGPQVGRELAAIRALQDTGGVPAEMRESVSVLKKEIATGDIATRNAAMASFMTGMSAEGLTADEERLLFNITGDVEGVEQISQIVGGLQIKAGTKSKARQGALAAARGILGDKQFSELGLDRLTSMGRVEHEQTIQKALAEIFKKIAPGIFEDKEGSSVEGVQEQYVKANTEFVQAVHRFTSHLQDNFPELFETSVGVPEELVSPT